MFLEGGTTNVRRYVIIAGGNMSTHLPPLLPTLDTSNVLKSPFNESALSAYDNLTNTTNMAATNDATGAMFTEFPEYTVAEFINNYYLYVILAIGIPGNLACLATLFFIRPIVSSSVLMAALSVMDIAALTIKMAYFQLTRNDVQLGDNTCQLIFMFGTMSQICSNWILVTMTMERFVAIWFPFHVKKVCSKMVASVTVIIIVVVFSLASVQFIFTFEEVSDPFMVWDCRPKDKYSDFIQYYWYWIDGAIYAVIPILLILVLNTLIVVAVRKAGRAQRDLTTSSRAINEKLLQQRQITAMLLTASIVFIILILPNCLFFIVREYWTWQESMRGIAQYYLIYQIVFLLADMNHAVNFYLYCLSGRKFRQKFKEIVCCRVQQLRRSPSVYSNVTRPARTTTATTATPLSSPQSSLPSSPSHCCINAISNRKV